MDVIRQNQDIHNMRCQDGNAKTHNFWAAGRLHKEIVKSPLSAHLENLQFAHDELVHSARKFLCF
jgi:hypothetical protein